MGQGQRQDEVGAADNRSPVQSVPQPQWCGIGQAEWTRPQVLVQTGHRPRFALGAGVGFERLQ